MAYKHKKQKWVKKRHNIIYHILKPFIYIYLKIFYNYKYEKFKIKKGENYIILSNHQTTLDPVFVSMSFNKLPYFVASDTLFHFKIASKLLKFCFNLIPKSKGKSDYKTVKTMQQVLHENGNVAVFPEGNRTFTGSICNIPIAISKYIKFAKTPVILYNLCGGYGIEPRWSNKKRKGVFYGKIKRVLSVEEINALSIDELQELIVNELNHQELPTTYIYKSNKRAEKIERVLYICPECGSLCKLKSIGNYFKCEQCNSTWEYSKNLEIKKDEKLYKYSNVLQWYNFQLDYVRTNNYKNSDKIFQDDLVILYSLKNNSKKEILDKGIVTLYNDKIIFSGERKTIFELSTIDAVAASGKQQLIFRLNNELYMIENNKKIKDDFNVVKYVTTINYIKSQSKEEKNEFFGI